MPDTKDTDTEIPTVKRL